MPYGYGRGFGRGWGMGFGFRGSSLPWPFVGRGRGGLPRCGYFYGAAPVPPPAWAYPPHPAGMPMASYAPSMTKEEELDYLADQAKAIKDEFERIETRINELESKK